MAGTLINQRFLRGATVVSRILWAMCMLLLLLLALTPVSSRLAPLQSWLALAICGAGLGVMTLFFLLQIDPFGLNKLLPGALEPQLKVINPDSVIFTENFVSGRRCGSWFYYANSLSLIATEDVSWPSGNWSFALSA